MSTARVATKSDQLEVEKQTFHIIQSEIKDPWLDGTVTLKNLKNHMHLLVPRVQALVPRVQASHVDFYNR